MPIAPRFYQIERIATLVDRGLVSVETIEPAPPIPDPALAFAQTDLAGRTLHQAPEGATWQPDPAGLHPNPAVRYLVPNATVHGPEGVVTTGRYVIEDTLDHVDPARIRSTRDGPLWMPDAQFTAKRIAEAEHLLAGDCGTYYHWLLDGLARWTLTSPGNTPCLLPWTGAPFQVSAYAAIPALAARALLVAPDESLEVARLHWTGSLTAAGTAFHPALRRFNGIKVGAPPSTPDIFIARGPDARRPLQNEPDLALLAERHGFQTVHLEGMLFEDQVALFAQARRIVAPHGGGLANLVFCQPGASLLELHTGSYVNWCFRRLAATMEVRYGCTIGQADYGDTWSHNQPWTLDPAAFAQALEDLCAQDLSTLEPA